MRTYSEDALIEQPAIALFAALGWQTLNAFDETYGPTGTLGRETRAEVVLTQRLRPALQRLNPTAPAAAIAAAIAELTRDRSTQTPVAANHDVYRLLKDGVPVRIRTSDTNSASDSPQAAEGQDLRITVIDWSTPANNDLLLVSQLRVNGDIYHRRPDLLGFVNGLPLVFIELKAAHRRLQDAYDHNLTDYKTSIPHLFWYNALILLSNGRETRIGSLTAGWEHFFEWKRITSEGEPSRRRGEAPPSRSEEGEQGIVSLDTALRGLCDPTRLLDYIENFTLFSDATGPTIKLLAKNHQYLGVNNALAATRSIRENQGRLGVFWHTQGSGKSLSMVFFAQKVLRKLPGNWTFLIVTDRQELDDQIYKTFASAGAVTEPEKEVHANSGAHLQQLLRADHRYVFTLIQKFHTEPGTRYPTLSDRSDLIVITDEAHRSQYDTLALNMRNALPRAAFLAFTGTPLIATEEKTRQVFGDYVSVYNFRQSVEDGTTVPLYYENRIPELELTNAALDTDIADAIEAADLDDAQQQKLDREFLREYQLITRSERLATIADDLVAHFMQRGQLGKAMVVSIDKATAVRMYDHVKRAWQAYLDRLRAQLPLIPADQPDQRDDLAARIRYMETTDMAVVVSPSQNEVTDLQKKGADIVPHRRRMVTEDLETKFKAPADPLRLVFVCAMWMTGFDVPSVTTIYLDKPQRNHTLMQTIARANRVFGDKTNGLIVDYIGIFRNLQKALAIYGAGVGGATTAGDLPIQEKHQLVEALEAALNDATTFCQQHGVTPATIQATTDPFQRIALLEDALDALTTNDDTKRRFLAHAAHVAGLYRAILPDPTANRFAPRVALFAVLARMIRSIEETGKLPEDFKHDLNQLLDASILPVSYLIRAVTSAPDATNANGDPSASTTTSAHQPVDLSQLDFDVLQAQFATARKHTEAAKLRSQINATLARMVRLNRGRTSYLATYQRLIDDYNTGSLNVELFFQQLVALARSLTAEEQRAAAERLTEEELAIFDLLTRPDPHLTEKERDQVKTAARDLLATLKHQNLVLDWKKRQATRAAVLTTIRAVLDTELPAAYTPTAYAAKCDALYQHIYDAYADATHHPYASPTLAS
ncbi:MAG: Type I restriction-modification system, restriction subunit R [Ktedonobacterales bacterium]|jgi:type I restriction enzyme R subunit|nr:MAG: Type I restriction-modification system, restriction subunit R [Ktedonobacterales bacterium]